MTDSALSRRAFLAAGGGLIVAAATTTWIEPAAATIAAANKAISPLVLSSDLYASPEPQRFVFAIARGAKYASGATARVAFAPPGSSKAAILPTKLYKAGLPKGRGVYVTQATFPEAGVWKAVALISGKKVPFAVQVNDAAVAPVIGAAAPRAASPTTTNMLGVDPICTRQPECPLHTVSLSDVVGSGQRVAALFATPARCQSEYCGPVLDELLHVIAPYRDRVTFVHVEIWKGLRGADRSPTVDAWGIETEPWLYTIDGAGAIKGRIDGAFGKQEIVDQLDALVT
ncbi:MAG TPA: hypothetical protein VFC99_02950 [Acidimicrobiia bacterium]|nr:hypothetical protein [Acidimicrobiia bacterium]